MSIPVVTLRDTGERLDALTYLKCVVPAEMPAWWPEAALRAQCVAAASYAASKGWAVYSDTRDQAYNPAKRTGRTDVTVDAMAGILAYHDGVPARLFYSASCGGHTLDGWAPAYLRAMPCQCGREVSGHQHGLCQWGAYRLATQGYDWTQILHWYYHDLDLRADWGERPYLTMPTPPANRITLHVQDNHYPRWLTESMARLGPRCEYIVCIDPPMGESPFPAQRVLARLWIGGDAREQEYVDQGRRGAELYWAAVTARVPSYAWAILPTNEPRVESQRDRMNLVAFYTRLAELALIDGMGVAGPNDGVGRIGDDAAWQAKGYDWLERMHVVAHELEPLYRAVTVATSHSYGRRSGAEWTGWDDWTLRQRYIIEALPLDLQARLEWVCTEGGLDMGGGQHDGWLGPGSPPAPQYLTQIAEANRRLPPQVRGYALFTALPNDDWRSFEISESLWVRGVEPWIMGLDAPATEPAPDPVTDLAALATAVRWQQEEALRAIEADDCQRARQLLLANVARSYTLENALRGR